MSGVKVTIVSTGTNMYNLLNHANCTIMDTTLRDTSNPNIGPAGTLSNPSMAASLVLGSRAKCSWA